MMKLKRFVATVTVLGCALTMGAGSVSATAADDLAAQIEVLMAQVTALQTQLAELQGEDATPSVTTYEGIPSDFTFETNFKTGAYLQDVVYLKTVLDNEVDHESWTGSQYYGPKTQAAVKAFQEKYTDEVLASWGLTVGTGYVGKTTRAQLNVLLAAAGEEDGEEDGEEEDGEEEVVVPVVGSTLNVVLAADTPAAAVIADNGNGNFTKLVLAAGDDNVSISKIYVTRTGLTENADLENIKLVDVDGVHYGSIASLNTNSEAMITFSPNLVIEAGTAETYYIRGGFVNGKTAGRTATLGVASADDIVSNAGEVTGSFPINGNAMTIVDIAIGTATFAQNGTTPDTTPDVGDLDVALNNFKVTSATEGITIEQITVMEAGSAALSDVNNIELYDVTNGVSLGTVENWNNEGKASFTGLNISVTKGDTHKFRVRADIISGSSLTTNADIVDGTDVLATVKGNTYGFYITPTSGTWTTDFTGKGSSDQTIAAGALHVAKSASSPATGNIAPGDNQVLAVFDFTASGEEIRVSALHLDFDAGTSTAGTFTYDQFTNIKVYDAAGTVVAGPKDSVNVTAGSAFDVDFTDVFIVPVGTNQYTVKAKLASDTSSGDWVECGIDTVAADITSKGMTSNEDITETPSGAVEGNRQTVAAGSLVGTTLAHPVARSIAAGIADYVWMTASLNASASGEDVLVTAIVIEDDVNATGSFADIDNAELWADLTSENSARGDIYETKVTDTKQPTGAANVESTYSFTLTETLTVPKGSYRKIAFVGDLAAGATAAGSHKIRIDKDENDVTASGADTGETVTVAEITQNGQEMTVTGNGTLTLTIDSSSPSKSLILDETLSTVGIFKLAANNVEDLDLDSIKITDDGTSDNDVVDTFYFYSSVRADGGSTSDPIQTAPGGLTAEVQIGDGTVTIPADGYVLITVKALMNNVDGVSVENSDTLSVIIAASGDIDTTGLASGEEVDSTATSAAAVHVLYESYPVFSINSNSPSGTLIPNAEALVAIIDVTASGNKDITFDGAADPDGGDQEDVLYFQVAAVDGDASPPDSVNLIVKDSGGSTLDDPDAASTTDIAINFSDKDFVVPAGQTKQLYVYANLLGYGATGDSFQIWLNDTGTAIRWSVDYDGGNYDEVLQVFKGDIYAGALVKPGS